MTYNEQFEQIRKSVEMLGRKRVDTMKITLFIELGELMKVTDNHEKALEAYVKCLCMVISLLNHDPKFDGFIVGYHQFSDAFLDDTPSEYAYILTRIAHATYHDAPDAAICCLFKLGNMLRFTWDEIYQARGVVA